MTRIGFTLDGCFAGLVQGEILGALYNEHTHNLALLARIQPGVRHTERHLTAAH